MDAISVRCKTCKHAMTFSAEKAGKRAKCPKCDTIVLVKAEEEPEKPAVPAPEAAAPVANSMDDPDDGPSAYGVFTDPEIAERQKKLAEEESAKKKKKDKKKLPKVTRKIKAIADAELWAKVQYGLMFLFVGTCIWFFTHLAQGSYVVLGKVEFPEYANMIADNLERRGGENDLPDREQFWAVDDLNIYLGMIAGRDFLGFAKAMLILSTLLYFPQAIAWGISYVICLPVPRRFGTYGQILASLGLAVVNFISMFMFKLLPVLGIITYVLIPFVAPEIVLMEYNMERVMPIHVMWSAAPFWENFLNLVLKFLLYLQPTLGCIFLWSTGVAIKDPGIEAGGKGLTQMSLGTLFVLVAFHLLSLCGATPVLVIVLRVLYTLWYCFLLMFILQYAMLILKCRAVLYEKINPTNELE